MRKMMLSLAALAAVSVGTLGGAHAAPLGTVIAAPHAAAVTTGAEVQTVQYYGYGRPGYYHHHWRRWHHWHHWHRGY